MDFEIGVDRRNQTDGSYIQVIRQVFSYFWNQFLSLKDNLWNALPRLGSRETGTIDETVIWQRESQICQLGSIVIEVVKHDNTSKFELEQPQLQVNEEESTNKLESDVRNKPVGGFDVENSYHEADQNVLPQVAPWVVFVENEVTIQGVEGNNNSCYMDSSLNSMFLFNNIFQKVLESNEVSPLFSREEEQEENDVDTLKVREILLQNIAIPLYKYKSLKLSTEIMPTFRLHLSKLNANYIGNEMDPEEFISTLFGIILKTQGFYRIDGDNEGSHVFQTYADMTQPRNETDVQDLLEYSFGDSQIKLASIPSPGFIIKMPVTDGRHMFHKIFPNPTINLGNILKTIDNANGSYVKDEMLLSAVICLSNHHYTAFVRECQTKDSPWWHLDSFSCNKAESIENFDKSLEELRYLQTNPRLAYLLRNCYMCFYLPVASCHRLKQMPEIS